jgi:[ribosomal protein S5]-alanine N-acetyltransferase
VAADPIRSQRLDLVSLDAAALTAFTDGERAAAAALPHVRLEPAWPDERDLAFLRMRLGQLIANAAIEEWSVRAIVLREPQPRMIGHVGFHGPPGVNGPGTPGALEIGYTVFPAYRGAGHATEAAGALVEWARSERGIRHFIASVSPDNAPSIAVIRKLGFTHVGEQWDDEDGHEQVYEARHN